MSLKFVPKAEADEGVKDAMDNAILSNATHQSKEMELAEADMQSKLPLFAGKKRAASSECAFFIDSDFHVMCHICSFHSFSMDTCLCF